MQFKQFLNENLKNWFGNSKVVDEKGQPLRVMHGSPHAGFNKFKVDPSKRITSNESNRIGIWFTDDPNVASSFTTKEYPKHYINQKDPVWNDGSKKIYNKHIKRVGGIYPVYLKIENPKIYSGEDGFEEMMDDLSSFTEYISGVKDEKGYWRKRYIALNKDEAAKKYTNWLKQQGHDGVIIKQSNYDKIDGKHALFVVFSPNQIKSVFSKEFKDGPNISESTQYPNWWNELKASLRNDIKINI